MAAEGILITLAESSDESQLDDPPVLQSVFNADNGLETESPTVIGNGNQTPLKYNISLERKGQDSFDLDKSVALDGNFLNEDISLELVDDNSESEVFIGKVGFVEQLTASNIIAANKALRVSAELTDADYKRLYAEANIICSKLERDKPYASKHMTKKSKFIVIDSPEVAFAKWQAKEKENVSVNMTDHLQDTSKDTGPCESEITTHTQPTDTTGQAKTGTFRRPKHGTALQISNKIPFEDTKESFKPLKHNFKTVVAKVSSRNAAYMLRKDKTNSSDISLPIEPSKKLQRNKFGGSLRVGNNTMESRTKRANKSLVKDDTSISTPKTSDNNVSSSATELKTSRPMIKKSLNPLSVPTLRSTIPRSHITESAPIKPVSIKSLDIKPVIKAGIPKYPVPGKTKVLQQSSNKGPVKAIKPTKAYSAMDEADSNQFPTPMMLRQKSPLRNPTSHTKSLTNTSLVAASINRTTDTSTTFDSPPSERYMKASSTPSSSMCSSQNRRRNSSSLPTPTHPKNRSLRTTRFSSLSGETGLTEGATSSMLPKPARIVGLDKKNRKL